MNTNRIKNILAAAGLLGIGAFTATFFISSSGKTEQETASAAPAALASATVAPYVHAPQWYSPDLNLAGEIVPLNDFEVLERVDREVVSNVFRAGPTLMIFKRAARWFPVIEPVLKANNVPDDFKYLCIIESELANVVSPAGASGFWQFMKATAPAYGLEVNEEVDERYHVEKSTEAACRYLNEAYRKFGSWTLAAASYNMGMGGVNSKLTEQQQNNYYDLYLNTETHRYVARLLAFKIIFSNPEKFGFSVRNADLYPSVATREKEVNGPVSSWVDFAKANGTSYKILKELNPWLRKAYLTNSKRKTYRIKLPAEGSFNYQEAVKQLQMPYAH